MAGEQVASATVTAPAAGATICSLASGVLPAGKYRVTVTAYVSNNAVADLGNMELQRGGVDLVSPVPHGANGQPVSTTYDEVDVDGAQDLAIKAIGVGTAAIEYQATLEALRIG